MSLATLPTLLIVPPLNFFVAACAGAALGQRRFGRPLLRIGLAGLFVFSLPIVSGRMVRGLETGLSLAPPPDHPPQAIVILSADEQQVFAGQDISFEPGGMTLEREAAGAVLAHQTGLPVLVTGGVMHPGWPSLASEMAGSMAHVFGVTVKWQETRSTDTWENAARSALMLHAFGIDSVYLVTTGWHMRRAEIAFRHAGLFVTARPTALDVKPIMAASFVPGAGAWLESYYAMHEYIGCAVYWLRARLS
jgi:uncharacterized SAM-binding protein YcdF (DUF218 family)